MLAYLFGGIALECICHAEKGVPDFGPSLMSHSHPSQAAQQLRLHDALFTPPDDPPAAGAGGGAAAAAADAAAAATPALSAEVHLWQHVATQAGILML